MLKPSLALFSLLLSLTAQAMPAAGTESDAATRRNNRINSLCTQLTQARHGYGDLKGAERDARNRQHAAEIQSCYQTHTAPPA